MEHTVYQRGAHIDSDDDTVVRLRSKLTQTIVEPPDGACRVRGAGILNTLHFAHQRGGSPAVEGMFRRLSESDHAHLNELRRKNWYTFALHCRVLRAVDQELGTGDLSVLYDVGHHSANRDFPLLFRPLIRRGRPGWILDVATRLWRFFHGEGHWQLDRTPHALIAKLCDYDEADEAFCVSFVGYVTAALEISGAQEVEGEHLACRAHGAPNCVYTVRWS